METSSDEAPGGRSAKLNPPAVALRPLQVAGAGAEARSGYKTGQPLNLAAERTAGASKRPAIETARARR